jgi:hypothetical protein
MGYKMKCPICSKDMIYTENKEMEALGWISMDCPDGCEGGYLVPKDNPDLIKE